MRGQLDRWATLWRATGLAGRTRLEVSSRLRVSLGRCLPRQGILRLHPELFASLSHLLDETLCHEFAHLAAHQLHGPHCRPHGQEWSSLVRAAGFEPRVHLNATLTQASARSSSSSTRIYVHFCPVCHTAREARRRVPQWRCAACVDAGLEGRMEIVRKDRE